MNKKNKMKKKKKKDEKRKKEEEEKTGRMKIKVEINTDFLNFEFF